MWAPLRDCVGELLDGVRRVVDEASAIVRPAAPTTPPASRADTEADTEADTGAVVDADGPPAAPVREVPPGPWRWRWEWPGPGRPAGMALTAADGTLVLWSPGGFASPAAPPDGRPTPDVAAALAALPELSEAAAARELLEWELGRSRAAAAEARSLLHRAVGTVDHEIDERRARPAPVLRAAPEPPTAPPQAV